MSPVASTTTTADDLTGGRAYYVRCTVMSVKVQALAAVDPNPELSAVATCLFGVAALSAFV